LEFEALAGLEVPGGGGGEEAPQADGEGEGAGRDVVEEETAVGGGERLLRVGGIGE